MTRAEPCLEVAVDWCKSGYSDSQGGDCPEVALGWRKSGCSDKEDAGCLEVASCSHTVHVRDSKPGSRSPRFAVAGPAWAAFVARARTGA